tara:strand:+ start:691 stop:1008 length:318 start_codon:yes stop_codon:yes gene_type:complete
VAELVCSARNQVDQAVAVVNALTLEDKIAQAEFSEQPDQVKIFRDAVDEIREKKDLTLAEAADQQKGKVAPVIAAREQLMATTICIDVEQSAKGESDDEDESEDE